MNLVTVCGHNTTMLYHMLRHYKPIVKNFFVNIYANYKSDPIIEEITSICNELDIEPHKVWIEEAFNWNIVTQIYNETTSLNNMVVPKLDCATTTSDPKTKFINC